MRLGTIVLTPFPFTDLSSNKRRPAVILSPVKANDPDVIVAFISSVIQPVQSECDFILSSSEMGFKQTGLKKTSVFKMDKLATLDKQIFIGEIGEVSAHILEQLKVKLRIALDL